MASRESQRKKPESAPFLLGAKVLLTPAFRPVNTAEKKAAVSTASLRYSLIDRTATTSRQKPLKRLSYLSVVRHRPEGRC
jgi:hypothetical protein